MRGSKCVFSGRARLASSLPLLRWRIISQGDNNLSATIILPEKVYTHSRVAIDYSYDALNRLTSVSRDGLSIAYADSGLGDRMQQTVNDVSTQYTLDINTGLTQVLQENGNTYLYGNGRIAQVAETQAGYFLPDAPRSAPGGGWDPYVRWRMERARCNWHARMTRMAI
ncbi:MAG: hypothetical protein LWX83_14665 [Anaerolineae bacterium]|nr:hypothetical protein [Anaerolineae bacterium]